MQQLKTTPLNKTKLMQPTLSLNRLPISSNTPNLSNVRLIQNFIFPKSHYVIFIYLHTFILVSKSFNRLARQYRYWHGVFHSTIENYYNFQFGRKVRGKETPRGGCEKKERRSFEITDGGEEKVYKNFIMLIKKCASSTISQYILCVYIYIYRKRQEKELKNKLAREAKEKQELEKRQKAEKEREEKAKLAHLIQEKHREEAEKKRLAQLQRMQEKEERRKLEEQQRLQRLQEQEETERLLAEQRRREQEAERRREAEARAQQAAAEALKQKNQLLAAQAKVSYLLCWRKNYLNPTFAQN